MANRITYNDIYSEWFHWGLLCTAWVNGEWVKMKYVGYTEIQARKAFHKFVNDLARGCN